MITLDQIIEQVSAQAFQEGARLFKENRVEGYRCRAEEFRDENGETYRIDSAEAEIVEDTAVFHAEIEVDDEAGYLAGWACECADFETMDGPCGHCAALLMEYVCWGEKPEGVIPKGVNPVMASGGGNVSGMRWGAGQPDGSSGTSWGVSQPGGNSGTSWGVSQSGGKPGTPWNAAQSGTNALEPRESTAGLRKVLNQYGLRTNGAWLLGENLRGNVELAPTLRKSYRSLLLSFRIGAGKQSYVLKNITEFVDAVLTVKRVAYGKKLEFYHHREAFTEKSRKLIDVLTELVRDQKRRSLGRYGYVTSFGQPERELELTSYGTDLFFEAMEGETIRAVLDYQEEQEYLVKREQPRLALNIEGGQGSVKVSLENAAVLYGLKRDYYFQDGCVYMAEDNDRREMVDFTEYMEQQLNRSCVIGEKDLPAFCRDMLPALKEHFDVRIQGFDEKDYLPEKPVFRIYLDMPQEGAVSCALTACYGEETYNVFLGARLSERRDMQAELLANYSVRPYFNAYDNREGRLMLMDDEALLYRLLDEGIGKMYELGEVYLSAAMRSLRLRKPPKISVGVSIDGGLLNLEIHSSDLSIQELAEILSRYDRRKNYIRMRNGEFLSVQEDSLETLAKLKEQLHFSQKELESGQITVPKYRAMLVEKELKENGEVSVQADRNFRTLIRNMKTVEESDFEIPEPLRDVLREYQKTGYRWLRTLKANGFGGILADDMGLGKTLQVISFLMAEQGRSLIVSPASLVYNWKREFERFAPELPVETVTGNAKEREKIIRNFAKREGDGVLITSYDLLRRDAASYKSIAFDHEILDEAQFIKNHQTQAARAVKQVQAEFRLALTGTPVENRLSELWSIFDFLMPGFLFSYKKFREEFELPVVAGEDAEAAGRLQKMVRPFILRRLKKDVLKDLPDKLERSLFAVMEEEQRTLYDAHVQRLKMMLAGQSKEDFDSARIKVLAELTKLRQICCDPALAFEGYHGGAAKVSMCMELIEKAIQGGHKILLFSQFTTMLERLVEELEKAGIASYTLTGAVSKEKRMEMVERFQKDDVPVFCISLKAGGTGLNLTAADIVIHFDPWWNAAVQNQATDRAHRIGQKQVVTVYRLVARDTIEEKIIRLQEKKRELAEQILAGEGMAALTREELLALLQ
ncbi:MAG: DEAD/DEAH box helicase [Eubacteriales bacterium]|nr:DEAD/DEAH box helicase [Eubacteriales bacterium]